MGKIYGLFLFKNPYRSMSEGQSSSTSFRVFFKGHYPPVIKHGEKTWRFFMGKSTISRWFPIAMWEIIGGGLDVLISSRTQNANPSSPEIFGAEILTSTLRPKTRVVLFSLTADGSAIGWAWPNGSATWGQQYGNKIMIIITISWDIYPLVI